LTVSVAAQVLAKALVVVGSHLFEELFTLSLLIQPSTVLLEDAFQLVEERGGPWQLLLFA